MEIQSMTAKELGGQIQAGKLSAVEAADAFLDQIDRVEQKVHSFVSVDREDVKRRAQEVQKKIESGQLTGRLPESLWR